MDSCEVVKTYEGSIDEKGGGVNDIQLTFRYMVGGQYKTWKGVGRATAFSCP